MRTTNSGLVVSALCRPNGLSNLTIVIVEDHEDARGYLGLFLGRLGANVVMARNAFEGLEAVKNCRPKLVLSDISMPDRDGFSLLRDIRALGPDAGGRVPVVAMTALVSRADRAWIIDVGFQACLPKPFTVEKVNGNDPGCAQRLSGRFDGGFPAAVSVFNRYAQAEKTAESANEGAVQERFSCETQNMRKHIGTATEQSPPATSKEWLDLEEIARAEVSSEDPEYPIESAFKHGESLGWRASQPGEQTIRLLFDEPKNLRQIRLRFSEPKVERTQQFTLRWADSQRGPFRDIVRQQWNFNPRSSTMEGEDYKVDLRHVLAVELTIDPDLGKNEAFATLAEWRMA